MESSTDAELRQLADHLRERARGGESLDELLYECFALVREAGRRTMAMRHFDVQLIGGMVLHDGAIAEMKTGEGKTFAATLAVYLNALGGPRGAPRHRQRLPGPPRRRVDDAGLRPARHERRDHRDHAAVRREAGAYAADVTYGTNSEFGFDYLRDNMATCSRRRSSTAVGQARDGLRVPLLRDRRRGRLDPDRRGAHAADHLRRARAGRRPTTGLRAAGADDAARQGAGRTAAAGRRRRSSQTSTTRSTRSTRPSA